MHDVACRLESVLDRLVREYRRSPVKHADETGWRNDGKNGYAGYNHAPCAIQYCYSHLLREVQDLGQEFAQQAEVQQFVGTLAPQLAQAMKLGAQELKPSA